jgi:hypothetical protein
MDKLMTFEEAAERPGNTLRHMRRLVIERRIAYQAGPLRPLPS